MVKISERVPLSGYTTLRLGGPAARLAEATSAEDVVAAVRDADRAGDPVLVLGGGSNLVVADDGFPGTVVRVATSGLTASDLPAGDAAAGDSAAGRAAGGVGDFARVTAAAGENWDRLVEWAIAEKLSGIECLAGIPGLAGATPIQNVGAYGQEVAATISGVTVYDRATARLATLTRAQCGFGYRSSVFKAAAWPPAGAEPAGAVAGAGAFAGAVAAAPTGRYVVLDVTFVLERDPMSAPVRYAELAARLGVATGDRVPLADVRDAVLELRRGKGMVLDPADPDTASAGSFFTNPVLDGDQLAQFERVVSARHPGARVPRFPAGDGQVKVSAAWLIEHAGFGKGYPGRGAARISSKHTLALTNQGAASTADLIELARQVVAGVRTAFGVELANEPVLVGVSL